MTDARHGAAHHGRRIFTVLLRGLGVAFVLAVLAILARMLLYHQSDDPEHLELKQRYLERLADVGHGLPAGPDDVRPNIVLILFDDLGYGDVGVYGSRAIRTPHLDRLAREGALFTHGYAASPYCTGSRAALLTGRYAVRSGLDHVVVPKRSTFDWLQRLGGMNRRLPAEEITIAEVLRAAGYATGMFGKWHVGDESPSLPNERGFDTFYGLLHSNDMGRPVVWQDRQVAESHPIDQSTLTRRYTEKAVAFIEENRERPFFVYLPHTFPHVPLHASQEWKGRSQAGLYGDVVEELDHSTGAVVDALERWGLAPHTLVIATSDNGPWFQGSSGGTRGRKHHIFEGGMRVPLLVRWPERIPAGQVVDDVVMGIDVFPTVLDFLGWPLPEDRVIDGKSLAGLLEGRSPGPHDVIYYYQLAVLKAVRSGRFKYHERHGVFYGNPMDWPWGPMRRQGPWLFDLELDPDESYDVSDKHPEAARRLRELVATRNREMAENPRGWTGP